MSIDLSCPICGGELEHKELRLYKNILYCETGATTLGAIEQRLVVALLRSPGGLSTLQFAELVGTTMVNINSRVKQLNKKLMSIEWTIKNVVGRGRGGALYVIRRKEGRTR